MTDFCVNTSFFILLKKKNKKKNRLPEGRPGPVPLCSHHRGGTRWFLPMWLCLLWSELKTGAEVNETSLTAPKDGPIHQCRSPAQGGDALNGRQLRLWWWKLSPLCVCVNRYICVCICAANLREKYIKSTLTVAAVAATKKANNSPEFHAGTTSLVEQKYFCFSLSLLQRMKWVSRLFKTSFQPASHLEDQRRRL